MHSKSSTPKMEASAEDLFWEERIKRHIEQSKSLEEVKEIANLLLKVSMQRQIALKWVVKDSLAQMGKQLGEARKPPQA